MNKAQHICAKHELWGHIASLGRLWGEDEDFLKEYAKDVYNAYLEDLTVSINCFKELTCQARTLHPKKA